MSSMQEQARALGDPTRHDIFQYVVAAEGPIGVAELTEHFGLNHNAIRQHLAKLVVAELSPRRPPRRAAEAVRACSTSWIRRRESVGGPGSLRAALAVAGRDGPHR